MALKYTLDHEQLGPAGSFFAVGVSDSGGLRGLLSPIVFAAGKDGWGGTTSLSPDAADYLASALTRAATLARENAQVAA